MKATKTALALLLLLSANYASAAINPTGSRYDSRNQTVNYNQMNTTVVKSAVGYLSTIVFDDDEKVISADTGFPQGWKVRFDDNRVYLQVVPVTQKVQKKTDSGTDTVDVALDPETALDRWRTNLFVVTTKRNYSIELNAISFKDVNKVSFVVNYQYPQERRKEQAEVEQKRLAEFTKRQEENRINKSLEDAKIPRNWKYYERVAKGSEYITPDYAYDDGRFTYFGFNPMKKIPSVFVMFGDQETLTNPSISQKGNYTVIVVPQISDRYVLRLGNQVVGVVNKGFGQINIPAGETVSQDVKKEVIQ